MRNASRESFDPPALTPVVSRCSTFVPAFCLPFELFAGSQCARVDYKFQRVGDMPSAAYFRSPMRFLCGLFPAPRAESRTRRRTTFCAVLGRPRAVPERAGRSPLALSRCCGVLVLRPSRSLRAAPGADKFFTARLSRLCVEKILPRSLVRAPAPKSQAVHRVSICAVAPCRPPRLGAKNFLIQTLFCHIFLKLFFFDRSQTGPILQNAAGEDFSKPRAGDFARSIPRGRRAEC